MGRYSSQLSAQMADLVEVRQGQRALDVGCGPGALTGELVHRIGADAVAAVDPSEPFVEAARRRHPGVMVQRATAEALPFDDDAFDAALAQLVVHFMADPIAGLVEMRRVTRPGGAVAACVWDIAGERAPVSTFWQAARELASGQEIDDESARAGARRGHLVELMTAAGLRDVREAELVISLEHATFESWWEPYTRGVGPAGGFVARLDDAARAQLRERCRALLPEPPFRITAVAWAARGVV